MSDSNINDTHFDKLASEFIPDVILVRKHYPDRRRRRYWKLKRLNDEIEHMDAAERYVYFVFLLLT